MHAFVGILGLALLAVILWDAFENVILPRHVVRRFRLGRVVFGGAWTI